MTASSVALPGPPPDRIVGSIGNIIRFSRDIVGQADTLFSAYGPLVGITGGQLADQPPIARWILAQGAALNREIISRASDFHKPPLNKQLSPKEAARTQRLLALKRWGAGLFNLNGEPHREHRRILMPAFHKARVDSYVDIMTDVVEHELSCWRPETVRDIRSDMANLTLRIVTRCLVGENASRAEQGIGDLIQNTLRLGLSPSVFLLPIDVPGLPFRKFLNAVTQTDNAVRAAIAAKRTETNDHQDMLAMLLQAKYEDGTPLSEDHIIEHTGVAFIAGQETSSNALIWTILLLSQHPSVAADLLDEISSGLRGAPPSAESIGSLPLLDAVIRESLRIMPPVPMNARVAASDTELHGHAVPAGTHLLMSLYHTHRAAEVFDCPNRFDPSRWIRCKPSPYEFSPFGTGPRSCIGAQFAMTEIKVVLAMLLQRFRLEFIPGTRIDRATVITMSVKGRVPMKILRQDREFRRGLGGIAGDFSRMVDFAWSH